MPLHMTATVFVLDRLEPPSRLLFVRHAKGHLAGLWLPPGGHVEPGERPDAAALREVREETGIAARLLDLAPPGYPLCPGEGVARMPQPHHIQVEDIAATAAEPAHQHLDVLFVAVAETRPDALVAEAGRPARWLAERELDDWPVIPDARLWARIILDEVRQGGTPGRR
jgi:ADP-ribose pyrophosphatase YjhB (NUDIX family)